MEEAFQKIVTELQRSRQDSHELAHQLDEITTIVSRFLQLIFLSLIHLLPFNR
jgi:methyl-accepting chemotaxis protein